MFVIPSDCGNPEINKEQKDSGSPIKDFGDDSCVEFGDDSCVEFGDDSCVEFGDDHFPVILRERILQPKDLLLDA